MLSIGKVGGGNGDPSYYLDSVASGQEDYYTGGGEAPGVWVGRGAEAQGLRGLVDDDAFLAVVGATGGDSVFGYDLTFSAPKSVSVLYGVAEAEIARGTRHAHDAAVRDALGYLEREACWTRRGRNGRQLLRGEGLTVALFRHRSSRAGDPQLHTHAVVANSTTAAGRATTLDGRALYAHARTAGFLYQAALRRELSLRFGVWWSPVEQGVAELRGIDGHVRRHFSRRSAEIHEHMREHGGRSAKSAQIATLETRRIKDYNVPISRLREEWRARAAELGLGHHDLEHVLDRQDAGRAPDIKAIAASLAAPHGLTAKASAFDRRDIVRAWAEAHRNGASATVIEGLADDWLQSPDAVRLDSGRRRVQFGGARYSTVEMLRTESRLLENAAARRSAGAATVDPARVEARLRTTDTLSDEQRDMVRTLTTSGAGVEVVRAAAGTGKTRALATVRDIWEEDGIHVYGCAVAARAAVELEHLSGIDSSTVARLVGDLDQGYGLPHGSVLVVDEAGMVGSRALARLAEHAAETKSKLLLVGDDRQLPEIDAGGAFRGLAERLGAVELRELRRQANDWDREALTDLRRGHIDSWADAYRDHGRLVSRATAAATRSALVDDWWESARTGDYDSVMIAHRRADVAELNVAARERMRRDGRLGDEELEIGQRAFAVGDRVLARRNDRRREIVNGMRGEIVDMDLDQRTARVRTPRGHEVEIDSTYLDNGWLEHGYALTAHAAQGATVDRSFVLGGDDLYREWGYTALTRHTDAAKFYMVSPGSIERTLPGLEAEDDRALEELRQRMAASRRQTMAAEIARAEEGIEWTRERIESLSEERSSLRFWQRAQRLEVDRLLDGQQNALERQDARLTEARTRPSPTPMPAPDRQDGRRLRQELLEPPQTVIDELGPRPERLAARERWMREAARLLGRGRPAPNPTDLAHNMDHDTGLDL